LVAYIATFVKKGDEMSIKNRINRFIKEQKKKARKKFLREMGVLAQRPVEKVPNWRRPGKHRMLDGTMR